MHHAHIQTRLLQHRFLPCLYVRNPRIIKEDSEDAGTAVAALWALPGVSFEFGCGWVGGFEGVYDGCLERVREVGHAFSYRLGGVVRRFCAITRNLREVRSSELAMMSMSSLYL